MNRKQKFKNYLSAIRFMKMMKMIIARGKEDEDKEHPVEKDIDKYDRYCFRFIIVITMNVNIHKLNLIGLSL